MIKLTGEGFSINIEEDNVAYKNLKRFDGETVTINFVNIEEAIEEEVSLPEPAPEIKTKSIDKSNIWKKFYSEIPWDKENINDNPVSYSLLKSHLDQVLHGETGKIEMQEVEPGVFKSGNLFLIV